MLKSFNKTKNKKLAYLPGQTETWQWRGQAITYSVLGEGKPLILLHGLNAAAWAFELRNNLEAMARQYRVYAPDLPGFGRSERHKIDYTAQLYIEFIADFTKFVAQREKQTPAVLASGLTSAHLVGAVARRPAVFGPLMLVCPTGLQRLDFEPTAKSRRVHNWLKGPFGDLVFWLLTSQLSTKVFLGRDGYYNPEYIDDALIKGYCDSARQPNGKYAPISFATFLLNHSIKEEWPAIESEKPVLIIWGSQAKITPPTDAALFLETRPGTELKIIEQARLAPQDEQSAEFNALTLAWLSHHYPAVAETLTSSAA